jgi:hypothetical protein
MIVEQKKPFTRTEKALHFSVHVVCSSAVLAFYKYLVMKKGDDAAIGYEKWCKSPYDNSFCGSHFVMKEVSRALDKSINAVGGVFVTSLLLAVTGTVAGMAYRRFTKQTTEAAKQPLLQSKAASKPEKS